MAWEDIDPTGDLATTADRVERPSQSLQFVADQRVFATITAKAGPALDVASNKTDSDHDGVLGCRPDLIGNVFTHEQTQSVGCQDALPVERLPSPETTGTTEQES